MAKALHGAIPATKNLDILSQFTEGLRTTKPWDSIADFVTSKSFCGYEPFPRQLTLLKLIYLETENMTQFDLDTIESWRSTWGNRECMGVQSDIWERVDYLKTRGYRRFPHIQAVLGRRASKGWIGGILGAETFAYMISLRNWQRHYGIQANKTAFCHSLATNIFQAMKFQFADIRDAITSCRYLDQYVLDVKDHMIILQTPSDKEYIERMKKKGQYDNRPIGSLRCLAMTSTSASGRGATAFMNVYDEFAYLIVGTDGPRSSEQIYEAYQPSLQQFGKDQLTYIPSSPATMVGKFYNLYTAGSVMTKEYQDKTGGFIYKDVQAKDLSEDPEETFLDLTADPTMLITQLPSWGLYDSWEKAPVLGLPPKLGPIIAYDETLKRLEARNPTKFKVEYKGQFAEVENAYLDPDKVDNMFKPFWYSAANDYKGRVLEEQEFGELTFVYHAHADPGSSNANFAVAVAHLENAPEPDEWGNIWPHAIVDYMKVWRPQDYDDHHVDYVEIEEELKVLITKFPSMKVFSFDQWQSLGLVAKLKRMFGSRTVIKEVTFTKQSNLKRAEQFKSALNLGWIHSYSDNFFDESLGGGSLLKQEMKFLVEENGVIKKQEFGPVQTKDIFDGVSEAVTRLLGRSLDQWQAGLMGDVSPVFGEHGTTRTIDNASRAQGLMDLRQGKVSGRENLFSIAQGVRSNRYGGSTSPSRGRRP